MKGKVAQSFPFSWNLKLSKAPPKKACTDFELSPEQLAITECTYGECPKAHLQFDPCVIVNQCARLETSDFYILKCAKDTSTPFMLLRRSAITLTVWRCNGGLPALYQKAKQGNITTMLARHKQPSTESKTGNKELLSADLYCSVQRSLLWGFKDDQGQKASSWSFEKTSIISSYFQTYKN